ncbi:SAM13 protein, partial [Polypterus senegalus]
MYVLFFSLVENGQLPDPAEWAVLDVVNYFKAVGFEEQANAFQDQPNNNETQNDPPHDQLTCANHTVSKNKDESLGKVDLSGHQNIGAVFLDKTEEATVLEMSAAAE